MATVEAVVESDLNISSKETKTMTHGMMKIIRKMVSRMKKIAGKMRIGTIKRRMKITHKVITYSHR